MTTKPTQSMYDDDEPASVTTPVKKPKNRTPEPPVEEEVKTGHILDLPSNGKLGYPSTVNYRDIMVSDEEVLALATGKNYNRTLNQVIKSLVNDDPNFEKFTVHDRDYIMLYLWSTNYSPTKKVEIKCPSCGTESVHTVDFTKVDVSDINPRFKGYSEIPIKKIGKNIKVTLTTVGDENIIEDYVSKNPDVRIETATLAQSIDFGMPNVGLGMKLNWLKENVSSHEMGKIKQFHIMLRYGIDPVMEYKCKNIECGEVTKDAFPFQAEDIFFPTVSADIEEFL